MKRLLHAGCGSKVNKLPFKYGAFKEVRLDANPQVQPDILASIVAMPMVESESYEAAFCSHTLEHLYCHEVAMALAEFLRVLKPGGELHLQVPDLQSIGGRLALDQADHAVYQSPVGSICPLDMIYGHRGAVGSGNLFMAHRTGFTAGVLSKALEAAGFVKVSVTRDHGFELFATANKPEKETCDARLV